MDHRNLAPLVRGWALVGGMSGPRTPAADAWWLTLLPCRPDLNGDGTADQLDAGLWFEAFLRGDPAADQNDDGLVTPADWSAWIARANRGCL
jgi:hypothetical protein